MGSNRLDPIRKLAQKLAARGTWQRSCYETGPGGYGLYHKLVDSEHGCTAVVLSLMQ